MKDVVITTTEMAVPFRFPKGFSEIFVRRDEDNGTAMVLAPVGGKKLIVGRVADFSQDRDAATQKLAAVHIQRWASQVMNELHDRFCKKQSTPTTNERNN